MHPEGRTAGRAEEADQDHVSAPRYVGRQRDPHLRHRDLYRVSAKTTIRFAFTFPACYSKERCKCSSFAMPDRIFPQV